MYMNMKIDASNYMDLVHVNVVVHLLYYRRKKNWRENKKTANIEKAVTFFLEEIEKKFKHIWKGI